MTADRRPQFALMPWYPRDFRSSTLGWPLPARAIYRELLDAQWDVGALPADEDMLRSICVATAEEWRVAWSFVRVKFECGDDGRLRNIRLERHRELVLERSAKNRNKAKNAAAARWNDDGDAAQAPPADASSIPTSNAPSILEALLEQCPPIPKPLPIPESSSATSEDDGPPRRRGARQELHSRIIDAYHELLPDLPRIREWAAGRQRALNQRIDERLTAGKPADTVDYWRSIFTKVAASAFLSGRSNGKRNRNVGGLGWLIQANQARTNSNLVDVLEGKYDG